MRPLCWLLGLLVVAVLLFLLLPGEVLGAAGLLTCGMLLIIVFIVFLTKLTS